LKLLDTNVAVDYLGGAASTTASSTPGCRLGPRSRGAQELWRRYRPGFSGIEDVGYLIGATVLLLDAELALATNVQHFPMLEGLQPASDAGAGLVELPDRGSHASGPT
jgi:hypothetical protein